MPQAVNQLLDVHSENRFKSEKIDETFLKKPYIDLFNYYKNKNELCIGLYIENSAIGYEELFSSTSDSDALDKFIEKKLKSSGHGLKENAIDVILNPDNNFIIKEGQGAILIV